MWRDLTYTVRVFRGQPVVFSLTIAGLAITIALCTAMFSVVNAVAFGSSGVRDSSSLRRLAFSGFFSEPPTGAVMQGNGGYSDYLDLTSSMPSLQLTAAAVDGGVGLFGSERAADGVRMAAVSGNYFMVMGVRAHLGRTLGPQDDVPGAPPVAVVTFGLWNNRLGGDPQIVGKPLRLGDQTFTVVGVLARGFNGPSDGLTPAVWSTLARSRDVYEQQTATASRAATLAPDEAEEPNAAGVTEPTESPQARELVEPRRRWNPAVDVIGRIPPGASDAALEAQAAGRVRTRLADHGQRVPVAFQPVQIERLDGRSTRRLVIGAVLMTVVGLLVLLACANVANVLLGNAITRVREIGTRRALGASRARIARQLLTESLLLGTCAGASGYVLAKWLVPMLAASLAVPASVEVSPDLSVYAFVVALILLTSTVVGLAPASFGRRDDLLLSISNGMIASGPLGVRRLRSLLLGAQAAISVVLLIAAALLVRSLLHLATLDIGYDVDRLSVVAVSPRTTQWDAASRPTFWRDAANRLRQRPGVSQAALVSIPPFAPRSLARLPGGLAVDRIEASSEYFDTLGLKLLRGRGFTAEEVASEIPVAVICDRFARQFWGQEDPVGSTLERVWGKAPEDPAARDWPERPADIRIVGVVAHTITQFAQADAPMIVLPIGRTTPRRLLVRSTTEPSEGLARQIREAVREANVDTDTMITYVRDETARELAPLRTLALCGAIIGIGSVLLAVMGISGVAAFLVAQRRREFAIRLSVGATHAAIIRMILWDTLTTVIAGVGVGLGLALPAGQLLRHVLFGLSPRDPGAMTVAIVLFTTAAVVAVLLPARRALRIDAIQALKGE